MTTHEDLKRPTGARIEGPLKGANGQYFWRRLDSNGEEVSKASETYEHRQHALDQAVEEAKAHGLRLFEPGYDSDGTDAALHWVEVDIS